MEYKLDYGKSSINFNVDSRNVICELQANDSGRTDLMGVDEVIRALRNPIGTQPLPGIIHKGEKICIITSDITRPCPSQEILPPLIDDIIDTGIDPDDITIVFALGSHRRHTQKEMRYLTGDRVFDMIRTVDSDPDDVIRMGYTSRGTPVDITAAVASADRRICVGNIEMHYFAGYSGGAKALMPGVSSREAIQANHRMMIENTSAAGRIEDNNLRLDIEEAGDICRIDFILNVVLDEQKQIVFAVAGDQRKAHREGCRFLDRMYKISIPQKADIVIASPGGYPKDINLYQAQKALDNAKHAVKDNGIIILVAECSEGFGEDVFAQWLNEANSATDLINRIRNDFRLGGHKAAAIAMVVEKCSEVILVTEMPSEMVSKTYMRPFSDIESAIERAFSAKGKDAGIIIMPHAGSTLPFVI